MTDQAKEMTGKLELLPNPCTTKPCLPGLAFAVVGDDRVPYFLTRNGRFCMQNVQDLPSPGERVVVVGDRQEQKDVNGNSFKTIEITSIGSATS
jgi:hypothetical protein